MIGGVWNRATVGWVLAAAVLPVLAGMFVEYGLAPVPHLLVGLVTVAVWQLIFRALQGVQPTPAGVVTAVAVALLSSDQMSLFQIVLAVSFGTVIGELIFGGWGRNVFSPAVVALAFLYLSFPEASHPPSGTFVALGCIPAVLVLVATGIAAWQTLAATGLAWVAVAAMLGAPLLPPEAAGTLAFAALFLVADPVASAVTGPGRWCHGALAGALAALFAAGSASLPQAVVFAALLASIFAPLLDQGAIALAIHRRKRAHG